MTESNKENPQMPSQTSLIIAAVIQLSRSGEVAKFMMSKDYAAKVDAAFLRAINGELDDQVLEMVEYIKSNVQIAPKIYEEPLSN